MTSTDIARIERLMTLATGDEKHDSSFHSTLDVLWVLYDRVLRFDPENPGWENRDRFVLSKGHGCASFYAILADKGFFSTSTLRTFMQYDSILGAHPDRNQVPGVEPYYEGVLVPDICSAMKHTPIRIETIGVPHKVLSRYGNLEQHDEELGLTPRGIRRRIEQFLDYLNRSPRPHPLRITFPNNQ